ncbi:WapI family immunity protein [Ktedonobacter racemifer]|uniref:Uncharacterized protein n=1 Tax=Ktedonobacter racemifer DSM 44963 TaxID=485913 RepID=D6U789_KTERA|nr:hypothetical protein [Ktedonobacter racemifer]EFH79750.1 hypothetical protein Krac_0247 [Ktedonobacter racemifer DSM 44963]
MDSPTIIEMKGNHDYFITITLQSDPFIHSRKADQNTIAATWFIKAGRFQSQFEVTFEAYELVGLLDALQEVYQQVGKETEVQFALEWYLVLTFKLSKIGHLEVETEAWTSDVRLSSSMQADQSFLPFWIREVKNALQRFSLLD